MTELVSIPEANRVMLAILIAAPIIGAIWGVLVKQLKRGLVYGVVIGLGNFVLWTVYNAITDHLGLDTVKNLLVNLGLFIVVGVFGGLAIRKFDKQASTSSTTEES